MRQKSQVNLPLHPLLPTDVTGYDALAELALDMRSSWSHGADDVWRQLDAQLWEMTRNPWAVLQTASRRRIEQLTAKPAFRKKLDVLLKARRKTATSPAWFQLSHPDSPLATVAYFSMEFMLGEALPIYSGGLGNVAGDQLKAASDLGVPVVGVGLLWQQGYFRQVIDKDGQQQALYPYNDPGQLPITPLRQSDGEWLRFSLDFPGHPIWLRAWQVQVGRVRLYLLDSNDAANHPTHRGITSELYGGGPELRLMQELVLGIGGWRLLCALGIKPEVCHLNEGHAALAVLERARSFMQTNKQPFAAALAVTRAGNLFTTHTAVAAGFDRFEPALIEHCLGEYARTQLGIPIDELLALGRQNPSDASEPFNMAYLAVRSSGTVNAVSALHGQVSRRLFAPLFPRWPQHEVPIGHVTNGVHMPTWDSAPADALWTAACGQDRWLRPTEDHGQAIRRLSDEALWQFRTAARTALVDYARARLATQKAMAGAEAPDIEDARQRCHSDRLTLGFARRFATYKRPDLLLRDPERLVRLLTDPQRPVQLLLAGKAHPADTAGQALIQQWMHFIGRPEVRSHVIFLSDYDMHLTEHLVQGVDVWLNTPRRPWEACGTSGMKVLVNGGLNLSVLDGWWAEAYSPQVGWALGDGNEHGDESAQDSVDAEALYTLLEEQVIAQFYTRDSNGIPSAWVARMRESMAQLTPQFSSNRSVREYTERYYLPAASAYLARCSDNGATGLRIQAWRERVTQAWPALRFGEVSVISDGEHHAFEIQVHLDALEPGEVEVELYAEARGDDQAARQTMSRVRADDDTAIVAGSGAPVTCTYRARISASRPASDYTARLMPRGVDVAVPLESAQILWQR